MRAILLQLLVLGLVHLGALASVGPRSLEAQVGGDAQVFLAIPDDFPDVEARAVIIREPGREVVMLRSTDVSPETLAMALQLLRQLRDRYPRPTEGQMVPMTGYAVTKPIPDRAKAGLEQALSRLLSAEPAQLGNLGSGRWIPYRGR